MTHMRKLAALLAVMLAILALGPAPAARAASAPLHVFPPQARPYGHTYTEWEIRFWQWLNAIPVPQNPWLDSTGAHCAVGQSGPAWYLLDNLGVAHPVVRTCTVPAGTALFVAPGIEGCATANGDGDSYEALRKCTEGYAATATGADVTVDGIHIPNVFTRYFFMTPLFTFKYPAHSLLDYPSALGPSDVPAPGPGITKSVGGGNFVMLAPLAAGRHTLDLRAWGSSWAIETTYHLTIGR